MARTTNATKISPQPIPNISGVMKSINVPKYLLVLLVGIATSLSANAQPAPGNCSLGGAVGTLDVNNVLATVAQVGSTAWGPGVSGSSYLLPRGANLSPLFAGNFWIGGEVGGDLRVSAATYGQPDQTGWEMWPGPLGDDARPVNPNDCSAWDRIWKVNRQDIIDFEAGGDPTSDLLEWPYEQGAPVVDGDGNPDNYDLDAGDRPDIIGDQSIFWILNDVGNEHIRSGTAPIGVQLTIQGFAFSRDNALNDMTFWKYTVTNKWSEALEDAYLAVFSDPDLGDAADDFVGVDTTLSLGYVYNDGSDSGYGLAPPAFGYDFFQGALVPSVGDRWEDPCYDAELSDAENEANGCLHVDATRLGLSGYMYFVNGDANRADPGTGVEFYRVMQSIWPDGTSLTEGGTGYDTNGPVTKYAFAGDPVSGSGWSEEGEGLASGDRRFVVSTGPFTLEPGDTQELVLGMVYGQGVNRLSSITAMRAADLFAQSAFDLDFDLPIPALPPPLCDPNNATRAPGSGTCFAGRELDGELNLTWGYAPSDGAYLGDYESKGYEFEGFNVYEYPDAAFNRDDRELIATFDKVNGITTVHNQFFDPAVGEIVPVLAAQGTDNGLNYSLQVTGSRFNEQFSNYRDVFFGLTTYMVDEEQPLEKVIESAPRQLTVRPSNIRNAAGGTTPGSEYGETLPVDVSASNFAGDGNVFVSVVDPMAITGDNYAINFFNPLNGGGTEVDSVLAYDIVNLTTSEVIFDGQDYYERTGLGSPQTSNVIAVDGLSWTVNAGSPPVIVEIPPGEAAASIECHIGGTDEQLFLVGGNGANLCDMSSIISRTDWRGGVAEITPTDIEIRYVADPAEGQYIFNRTWDGADPDQALMAGWETADAGDAECSLENPQVNSANKLPFTVWEVGADGSERQVMASVLGDDGDNIYSCSPAQSEFTFDRPTYERIYINHGDYDEAAIEADVVAAYDDFAFWELDADPINATWGRLLIAPNGAPFGLPVAGSAIRFITAKPNFAGDRYVFPTSEIMASRDEGLTQEDVDRIYVTPNPYGGLSEYESGNEDRIARFTNLPEQATIRVFTISGTLVRTLQKDNASRSFDWNLRTEQGLPIASGMYLIHIELPQSGLEKVIKFGVVQRQTQIPIL